MDLPLKEFDEVARYHYVRAVVGNWVRKVHLQKHHEVEPMVQEAAIVFEKKWAETQNKKLSALYARAAAIAELRKTTHNRAKLKFIPLERSYITLTRKGFKNKSALSAAPETIDYAEDPIGYFDFDPFLHRQLVHGISILNPRERKVVIDWLNDKKGLTTAKELGISQGRVTQIRNRAIELIRQEIV